ncbi:hypothetical protein D3C81_2299450 [compost metagenome]
MKLNRLNWPDFGKRPKPEPRQTTKRPLPGKRPKKPSVKLRQKSRSSVKMPPAENRH